MAPTDKRNEPSVVGRRFLLSEATNLPPIAQEKLKKTSSYKGFWIAQGELDPTSRKQLRELSLAASLYGEVPLSLPKAVFFDMDATTIVEESIVVLAEACGREQEIGQITERAMAGELDFERALRERVAMLQGVSWDIVSELHQRLTLNPGIKAFWQLLRQNGIPYYLVSGGFRSVLRPIAESHGFAGYHANTLQQDGGILTGQVIGTIVDAEEKRCYLRERCAEFGWGPSEVMAVGDGANDLPMLQEAGWAVGFNPKPVLLPHLNVVCGTNHYDPLSKLLFT